MRLVPTVLLADADAGSCAMVRDALLEGVGPTDLRTVASAAELDDYLHQRGDHEDDRTSPPPALIVIDQDLPGNDDFDAVRSIKSNADLRRIPVVVLARVPDSDQTAAAYDAGANTVIAKPVTFLALVKLMKVFTAYWLEAAALPPERA
ncbi:MAG TPA: response regulator [Solirubrobacteraceae bacterium]|nr:response regulator [Solirubrobacteraceae bacterium]